MKTPWYKDGLRFECTGCGACCTGEPGYVWISVEEMTAVAEFIDMSLAEFQYEYAYQEQGRWSLRELPGGDCIFFDRETNGCLIYELRPTQCRTWPFWSSNLRKESDWEATCDECPGAGQGPLIPLKKIEALRGEIQI
jgi:Fe-S-cluster containining protein